MSLVAEQMSSPAEPEVALLGPWDDEESARFPVLDPPPDSLLPHIFLGPGDVGPAGRFLSGKRLGWSEGVAPPHPLRSGTHLPSASPSCTGGIPLVVFVTVCYLVLLAFPPDFFFQDTAFSCVPIFHT